VLAWEQSYKGATMPMMITPTGSLKVTVLGEETYAAASLAMWAAMNRACMDGSAYKGIQFTATGNVTSLHFRIGTAQTYPVADGGTCANLAACGYAHYQKIVTTELNSGKPINVSFKELTPPFGTPPPFDDTSLISLVFLTLDPNKMHSFTIDNISYLLGRPTYRLFQVSQLPSLGMRLMWCWHQHQTTSSARWRLYRATLQDDDVDRRPIGPPPLDSDSVHKRRCLVSLSETRRTPQMVSERTNNRQRARRPGEIIVRRHSREGSQSPCDFVFSAMSSGEGWRRSPSMCAGRSSSRYVKHAFERSIRAHDCLLATNGGRLLP
jgi:hypothetical protein